MRWEEAHSIRIVHGVWWCLDEDVNADECSDEDRCSSQCVCNNPVQEDE